MSRKKTTEVRRGRGCVMGIDCEFEEDFDFTYCHTPDDFTHDRVKATPASSAMRPEPHPWLRFSDTSRNAKIIFKNKLAEIQNYPVARPKVIDWELLNRLGVRDEILAMIQTTGMKQNTTTDFDMWRRLFSVNTPAHREWCLEFYSTLEVENVLIVREIAMKQTIHFRLGGVQRHCTVFGFAYLIGMITAEEMKEKWVREFVYDSHFNTNEFLDGQSFDTYWERISGLPVHNPHSSKLSEIRSKRLRILHKMITNSFLHRGDNNDKVYSDDLWLLRYFHEFPSAIHVLAPYLLVRHMARHKEKRLVCGHFVSMIASRLGVVDRDENLGNLSIPVLVGVIGELDLVKSKLLSADKTRLLGDDEGPAPARRVRRRAEDHGVEEEIGGEEEEEAQYQQMGPQPYGFNDIRDALDRMGGRFDQFGGQLQTLTEHQAYMIEQQRFLASQQHRMGYTMDYYRPVWQHSMDQMYQGLPDPDNRQIPVYSPPELYTPRQYHSGYPFSSYTQTGGAGPSQQTGSTFHAGDASGSGAGGAGRDHGAPDLYGAGLFGTQYFPGLGTPSIFKPPRQE